MLYRVLCTGMCVNIRAIEGLDLFQGLVLLLKAGEDKAGRKNPKIQERDLVTAGKQKSNLFICGFFPLSYF